MKTTIFRIAGLPALLIQSIEILERCHDYYAYPADGKMLTKLAKSAGRTPEQMLKLVAEHGFPVVEDYIEKVGRGIAQADNGELLTTEQVFSSIEKKRGRRLVGQKQAA